MKIIVRAFVVALALTGAVATASANNNTSVKPSVVRPSGYPIPSCPPSDPTGCGVMSGN